MLICFLLILFFLGLVIGSFLNVIIYRLEKKKRKSLRGRSFCPHCGKEIAWYDNIPILSWLILAGKCRSCKKAISIQYPLVELSTGLLFIATGYLHLVINSFSLSNVLGLVFWLIFFSLLVVIFVYDFKHQIIPDEIVYIALMIGLAYVAFNFALLGDYKYLADHLLSGLLAGGFFYSFVAISGGKWMGGGDIKLAAFMGLVLGWQSTLVALYVAFTLGAIAGVCMLLLGRKKMGSKISFGPFLVAGAMTGFFLGEHLLNFYVNMFL